ncbi:MAG: ParB N-terminal domain-containing protein [Salinibacterium sp.]|nr:ParB N-terminal domain-containing protein [Salinibacterium sp.]
MSEGHIELARAVDSIRVGPRFREDMGDLDELVDSIGELGLLQPITITPDGLLLCGARRLAAMKRLGKATVNVWVRTGITTELQRLLVEQHENTVRKPLTPTEAARLYRELKRIYAEDATRAVEATRFPRNGETRESAGVGKFPTPAGPTRERAAADIGGYSYTSLEHVGKIVDIIDDTEAEPSLREIANRRLALVEQTGVIDPHYRAVRQAQELSAVSGQDAAAEGARRALARAKAARARPGTPGTGTPARQAPAEPRQFSARVLLVMLSETDYWWLHYDPQEIARALTGAQWEQVADWQQRSAEFLEVVRKHRRDTA